MNTKIVIDRIEGDKAVLKTEGGDEIIMPKKYLPENVDEGAVLWLAFAVDAKGEKADKELAKNILNEILNNNDED